jgi:hypothetical protein
MSVRQAITDLTSFLQAAPPAWRSPEMATTAFNLSRRAAMVKAPTLHADPAALQQKFRWAIETNDWTKLDTLDWCDIAHLLWTAHPGLLAINRFQINYRRFLESSKTARPFKRLIYAYLEAYDPHRDGIEWAGGLIRKILVQKKYFILEYWRKIELELQVFSTSPGPRRFAARCLAHPESVFRLQQDLGLVGALATGGYARQAYLVAMEMTAAPSIAQTTDLFRLQRFIEWTIHDVPRPFLRFPELQPMILRTLLPSRLPPPPVCELLGKFFIRYAEAWRQGDPSCQEPSASEIATMGRILTAATKG